MSFLHFEIEGETKHLAKYDELLRLLFLSILAPNQISLEYQFKPQNGFIKRLYILEIYVKVLRIRLECRIKKTTLVLMKHFFIQFKF